MYLNVIGSANTGTRAIVKYWINKDYDTWGVVPRMALVPKTTPTSATHGTKTSATHGTHINNKQIHKQYIADFDALWALYPKRIDKKSALKSYLSSVKTEQDHTDIKMAFTNYLSSKRVKDGYAQDGFRWFRKWRDWINWQEDKKEDFIRP